MYKLNTLPYSYDELEPYIDTHTLGLHYNKHQKKYLKKLNELLVKNNFEFNCPIEEVINYINTFSKNDREDILFNLGGVLNHAIYFNSMSANGNGPSDELLNKINASFNSYDEFKEKFTTAALMLKGSGYTFLVIDDMNNLRIINLYNQDTPYYYNFIPLLCIDMWEHAYYINYENKKDIYINNFFDVIDFSFANNIFGNRR